MCARPVTSVRCDEPARKKSEKSFAEGSDSGVHCHTPSSYFEHVPVGGDRRRAARRGRDARRAERTRAATRRASPKVAAEVERLGGAAKVLLARRAVDGNGWRNGSDAILPEQWFARLSGCSESEARRELQMSEKLAELPATEQKLRDGSLSLDQAALVADGASADPTRRRPCCCAPPARVRCATCAPRPNASSPRRPTRPRAAPPRTANATCGPGPEGFATHGAFSGPTEEVAVLLARARAPRAAGLRRRSQGRDPESHDAYRFDALIGLAAAHEHRAATPSATRRSDASASTCGRLLDGKTRPGEVCEIPGVGPVPVAHARKVLSHGLLELVISDGVDVQTVVSTTRHVPEGTEDRDRRTRPDLQRPGV